MKPVIIDNFLDKQSFHNLQNIILGDDFNWFYNVGIDYPEKKNDKFQFTHIFYKTNVGVNSDQYEILNPILTKFKPKEIFRIKSNLLTRTPNIVENEFHVDADKHSFWTSQESHYLKLVSEEKLNQLSTSIFYVNTNNGYTKFEDGTKVESVANRIVTFPANMKHTGTSCTDEKTRVVINFNYFK